MKKYILKLLILPLLLLPIISYGYFLGTADDITDTSATLRTNAGLGGGETGYFRYAALPVPPIFCNQIYGSNAKSTPDIHGSFTYTVEGLSPNTTYYFCAIKSSKDKIDYGNGLFPAPVYSFRTLPCEDCPQAFVKTTGSTVFSTTTANMQGEYGSTRKAVTYFEYKEKEGAGDWTKSPEENHNANTYGKINYTAVNLKPDTFYEFRAVVETEDPIETFYAQDILTFKTWKSPDPGDDAGWVYEGEVPPWEDPGGESTPFDPDDDNDDIPDEIDDEDNNDTDGDDIEDVDDTDDDNDDIPDWIDEDDDNDGTQDDVDNDADNDDIPDDGDTDDDGSWDDVDNDDDNDDIPDFADPDDDNDGVPDYIDDDESDDGDGGDDSGGDDSGDLDDDGIPNSEDNDVDGDGTSNNNDPDDDNDGIPDVIDGTPFGNFKDDDGDLDDDGIVNSNDNDIDGDGNPNSTDNDDDNDGVPDGSDPTPNGGGDGGGNNNGNVAGLGTKVGEVRTPPNDAIVRYHEGVETVFIRQIMRNTALAKKYGYKDGEDLQKFAWYLAHFLGRNFGYVAKNRREVRVRYPDVAAYELIEVGNSTTVYESYDNLKNGVFKITGIRKLNGIFKTIFKYEYYFLKKR